MKTLGRFALGSMVGFSIMAMVLVALHAEPVRHGVAIPSKPTAKLVIARPMHAKCYQMGMTPCGK